MALQNYVTIHARLVYADVDRQKWGQNEPAHEKTCFSHAAKTQAELISLSAFVFIT